MEKLRALLDRLPVWFPTAVIFIVILWLTLSPKPVGDVEIELFPGADKLVHALMFGFFSFVMLIDFSHSRHWQRLTWKEITATTILSICFGISVEYMQRSMNLGRGFETADMAADTAGVLLTVGAWILFNIVSLRK